MYVTVIQNNPKLGALRENADKIIASIDALAESTYPPDLVILPAYALTGTPVEGLLYFDAFAAETLETARSVIERAKLTTLVGTMIPRPIPEEMTFICEPEVLYCKDGKGAALGFVDIDSSWDEDSYASSITISIDGHSVSILLDEYPDMDVDLSDSEIVIVMLAKEYQGTKMMFTASDQIGYLRKIAQKNGAWLIVVNLVGAQDESVFDGASIVIKPDGSVAQALTPFEEGSMSFNINLSQKTSSPGKKNKTRYEDAFLIRPLLPYEADWRALKLFVRDYVHKNGFTDVVIGLSGGLDSAVCAVLACDALGAEHVYGILMPSRYTSQESIDDSLSLAENLGIKTLIIPIENIMKAFASVLEDSLGILNTTDTALAEQNIQNRIRMTCLMYLSNCYNWMMINTSNKSELAMGYSTLYGDSAGALAPLGNIYKTDVYGLANWRNEQSQVIPENTLTKAPSAELYEGQTDEDALPPYALLDIVLRLHIEESLGVDHILHCTSHDPEGEGITSELVEHILGAVKNAEYKRRHRPVAPTLGFVDMNLERGWPLTNAFVDRKRGIILNDSMMDYLGMIKNWKLPGGWDFLAN